MSSTIILLFFKQQLHLYTWDFPSALFFIQPYKFFSEQNFKFYSDTLFTLDSLQGILQKYFYEIVFKRYGVHSKRVTLSASSGSSVC